MIIRVKKGPAKHEKVADFECLRINGKRIKAVIHTGDNCK